MKTKEIPSFGPLQGVRVVHMTTAIAGPFAATMLADMGADVIGIENPAGRDSSRPFALSRGMGQELDRRNSRSLCLDVVCEEGRKVFYELLKSTDILMEAYRGGQLAKWGMTDEALWEINPKLVIVHISGYGQTGLPEYVNRASYDGIGQAFSGFMDMNGFPDRDPVLAFPQVSDYYSGFMAITAGLAALHRAEQTGKGESVDVSQVEAMIRCTGFYIMRLMNEGIAPVREGSHSTTAAGYGAYRCKDGECVYMLLISPGALKKAMPLFGLEYGSEMFPATMPYITMSYKHADVFEAAINKYCQEHTSIEVEKALLEAGAPCTRINKLGDTLEHPFFKARGLYTEWESTHDEIIKGPRPVPVLKNNPGQIWRGMPLIGQDNDDILTELGFSGDYIQALYDNQKMKVEYDTGFRG